MRNYIFLSRSPPPPRLAFLAWGDFHARSRFARSTIPEEKFGLLVVYRNRAESAVLVCQHKPYPVLVSRRRKSYPYLV